MTGPGPSSDPRLSPRGGLDEARDATRRTHLANERTYLAWWRTGLTAFAVALGAGKLVPALADVRRWPYVVLGAGFAVLGLLFIAYASWRHRDVEQAIARGGFVEADKRLMWVLAVVGVALGTLLLVLVVVES
jgi:putative membrane protein